MATDCVCLYSSCDEFFDFYKETTRTARKEHKCVECRLPIPPGQRYHHLVGFAEGHVTTDKFCLMCREIMLTFYCDGWVIGQLWSDVEEQMFREGGITSACLEKLVTPEAKQFLSKRWWDWVNKFNEDVRPPQ